MDLEAVSLNDRYADLTIVVNFVVMNDNDEADYLPSYFEEDFRDIHYRIWAGEISLATDEAKLQYAWVHMEQILHNMRTK